MILVFFFDYRTNIYANVLGWLFILGSFFGFINNNKINKVNKLIDQITRDSAKYVGFVGDSKSIVQSKKVIQSLKEKLIELESLKSEGTITENEYELKRKQIIDKY